MDLPNPITSDKTIHCTMIGKDKFIENIKLSLYKEDENIFDLLDFDNDQIYQEPLLYAYFNSNNRDIMDLGTILYGYIKIELRPKQIQLKSDKYGKVYLPNLGWIITNEKEQSFILSFDEGNNFSLVSNDNEVPFKFENMEFFEGTCIELLKYPIPLLKQYYSDNGLVDVEIENISKRHLKGMTKAWGLIKDLIPEHYDLITSVTKKSIIFNIDTALRNSFASLSVNGISFSNAYQENYNEVFFVDDIAHQTGHIIFYSLVYDKDDFFKVQPSSLIETFSTIDKRDVHIVLHAFYTYYTTIICIEACLDANVFIADKKHEALGRMGFYLFKCRYDLNLIETHKDYPNGARDIFTEKGLILFDIIKNTFNTTSLKFKGKVKEFDMSNQPYNFTYLKFIELNPLREKIC